MILGHVTTDPQSWDSLSGFIRSVTVVQPSLRPSAALIPNATLAEKNSTELLWMVLRFYNGRITVSVRPPCIYNNRGASVNF